MLEGLPTIIPAQLADLRTNAQASIVLANAVTRWVGHCALMVKRTKNEKKKRQWLFEFEIAEKMQPALVSKAVAARQEIKDYYTRNNIGTGGER